MDVREFLFAPLQGKTYKFSIKSRENGIFSGAARLKDMAAELGIAQFRVRPEGQELHAGSLVFSGMGNAETVTKAEEILPGVIGKPSGVATAAAAFTQKTQRLKVVCGAWKKVDRAVRKELRQAVITGGAELRITDEPFISSLG